MCIIAARHFPTIGWVGVKNRDRNYVPEISFLLLTDSRPHRLLMLDDMTGYMEGINEAGIGILSASLQVLDDEKEIKKRSSDDNPDGERIRRALKLQDIDQVVQQLVREGMTGNTIIFNQDRCYILEGCRDNDEYYHELEEVDRKTGVARTNHGILMPWAGYQYDINPQQDLSRESSEARLKAAELAVKTAETAEDLINQLAQTPNKNTQLNPLRTTTDRKKMRTTAQEMIVPADQTFYLRPIQSKLDIDFWRINQNPDDLWVEILSNRELRHPKATDPVLAQETNPYRKLSQKYTGIDALKPKNNLADLYKKYSQIS